MSFEEAKKKALSLLDRRDYSAGELKRKLTDKGFSDEDAGDAVARLVELGFINDENYAGMVVRHYAAKGFGPSRITQELLRRCIPRDMWDAALAELPEQEDTVYSLLLSRLKSPDPDRDELRKASNALRRRGFSWDEISAAADKYKAERNDI